MRMLVISVMSIMLMSASSQSYAKIIEKKTEYKSQGTTYIGYLVYDDSIKGKRPAVIVVHEWWGLNDYAKKRAVMLAQLGYAGFAIDMFGNGKTAGTPDDAKKFTGEVYSNFDNAIMNFQAAVDLLKKEPVVDENNIAAIGYCFGGGIVLNMAREGINLKGFVSFHGGLNAVKTATPGSVKGELLVLNGEADKTITKEQIAMFKSEMDKAGVVYRFINYPDALHAFTNPDATALGKKFNLPIAYNADADKKSWEEMKAFLKKIFKK